MVIQLGPIVAPCWTRDKATGTIAIRLWTGYSWLEFGSDVHWGIEEIDCLSNPLEYSEDPP